MLKFELMYYLGMSYDTLMQVNLAELSFYYNQLRQVKEQEAEIDKLKLEAQMMAMGARKAQKTFEGG